LVYGLWSNVNEFSIQGVINVMTSNDSKETGRVLCEAEEVGALSFTGSTRNGMMQLNMS
jgi:acyl-CoA reductase-like NAD-dependent aldehyde dehydrogenase